MTEKFVSAAALMAQVLGADGHPFVTIPHPISSATDEQLTAAARVAAEDLAAILTSTDSPGAHAAPTTPPTR
jgi:hypothetical protein